MRTAAIRAALGTLPDNWSITKYEYWPGRTREIGSRLERTTNFRVHRKCGRPMRAVMHYICANGSSGILPVDRPADRQAETGNGLERW